MHVPIPIKLNARWIQKKNTEREILKTTFVDSVTLLRKEFKSLNLHPECTAVYLLEQHFKISDRLVELDAELFNWSIANVVAMEKEVEFHKRTLFNYLDLTKQGKEPVTEL